VDVAGSGESDRDGAARMEVPSLHVVTDDEIVARPGFVDVARVVLNAGQADLALHLRAPHASGQWLYELAEELMTPVVRAFSMLIVNDRADVALAANAGGVQVGARGLAPEDARRVIGGDRLLGVSVHSVDEARDALSAAPDFLLAGTIWETPSHPGRRPAGIKLIRQVAALGVPVIAIGGVTPERARRAARAGAAGVAVMRGVWDAPNPHFAVQQYLWHCIAR
jgi:thiamine-phosphate diphosphorylase